MSHDASPTPFTPRRPRSAPSEAAVVTWQPIEPSAACRRVNELANISERAAEKGLPCLLAGGHAVITHGFARSTFDLDLIVRQEDREAWLVLAKELGYELHREAEVFTQFNAPRQNAFPLDLMFVNSQTFSKLRSEAVPAPSTATGLWVVSLMHLLALKCHAVKHGHSGRRLKDAEDVIQLIQIHGLNPEAEAMRELFRQHGTEEFYEKVQTACRRA